MFEMDPPHFAYFLFVSLCCTVSGIIEGRSGSRGPLGWGPVTCGGPVRGMADVDGGCCVFVVAACGVACGYSACLAAVVDGGVLVCCCCWVGWDGVAFWMVFGVGGGVLFTTCCCG